MKEKNQSLQSELAEIQILHENTLDHSSELENDLIDHNNKLESLQQKMKRYLSPQLYNLLLGTEDSENQTGYTRKKLTIFFSDIVGFSNITDSIESEVLSEVLNQYLNQMAIIATKWGGTIDKFIGDAVMVFFGDPEFIDDKTHAVKCVSMALEMLEALKKLRQSWKSIGFHHYLQIRIGINTGYCTVGNFGSTDRMDYTIVGGQVNIASRLESIAEPSSVFMSTATYDLVKEEFHCEYVDSVQVKGIHAPVDVFRCSGYLDVQNDTYFMPDKDGFTLEEIRYQLKNTGKTEKRKIARSLKKALLYLMEEAKKG
ncbi:MAG: hypothetical protein B0D92_04795 [Spirochaeta sp. LUC14_002_19_P3]|nr:MAG: hypothetical protein B0D92_04795 [Spirochaeta sp. LUC14_002_19_P3]